MDQCTVTSTCKHYKERIRATAADSEVFLRAVLSIKKDKVQRSECTMILPNPTPSPGVRVCVCVFGGGQYGEDEEQERKRKKSKQKSEKKKKKDNTVLLKS